MQRLKTRPTSHNKLILTFFFFSLEIGLHFVVKAGTELTAIFLSQLLIIDMSHHTWLILIYLNGNFLRSRPRASLPFAGASVVSHSETNL